MKTKEYQLKFIATNPEYLTMGMLVSISGKLPSLKFKKKDSKLGHPELGRIMGIQEDDRLGTTYIVMEYATGEWHKYIDDKLIAIAPVIVSEEPIGYLNIFIHDERLHICKQIDSSKGLIIDNEGVEYPVSLCQRLAARPFDIGYIVNTGPPHDRNRNWKSGLYLEDLHPDVIPKLYFTGGKIDLVLGDDLRPEFYDEKVILDIDKLFKKV